MTEQRGRKRCASPLTPASNKVWRWRGEGGGGDGGVIVSTQVYLRGCRKDTATVSGGGDNKA